MFKSSLQRNACFRNVARRQISTFSSLRTIRIRTCEQQSCKRVAVPFTQSLASIKSLPRFHSSESAAQHEDVDSEHADQPSNGLVTRFADLDNLGVHPVLRSAITEGMGYENMTDVQSMTINSALNGVDLVAQAKTGTGKTLAFLVPVFQKLLANKPDLADRRARRKASSEDIQAIILSPTRELAEQIGVEAKKLAQGTGIQVQTAVGGTRKREALQKLQREGCHILVATPGRLQDLLADRDAYVAAPNLKAFVLDEADRMLDVGFSDAIRDILDLLPSKKEVDRQTLLFSATIPKDVVHLAKALVKTDNFEFVQTIKEDEAPTHERVSQHVVPCAGYENWFPAIMEIADKAMQNQESNPEGLPFKAIVFFSNTATVEFAAQVIQNTPLGGPGGIPIVEIHSKLNQPQRTRAAEAFRRMETGIMFSSDVTARGMDFPNVSHVIQVGLPPDRDQYIHRIGRTGRAGHSGEAWLLLASEELDEARYRLPKLPIKPKTLAAASHQIGRAQPSEDVDRYISSVAQGYKAIRKSDYSTVYHSLLGQKFGRNLRAEDVVGLLNNWAQYGMGYDSPPAITARTAANRGLSRIRGINIGQENSTSRSEELFSGSRFGGSRGRGGDSFGDRFSSRPGGGRDYGGRGGGGRDFGGRGRRDDGFRGGRGGGRDYGDRF